jgi:hypothetical protein
MEAAMARRTQTIDADTVGRSSPPDTRTGPARGSEFAPDAMSAARTFANLTLTASRDMLQFMEQAQQARTAIFADMVKALGTAIGDTASARDMQELMAIPSRLTNEQLAQTIKHNSELFNQMLGKRARLMAQMPGHLGEAAPRRAGATGNGMAAGFDASPLAFMSNAQSAWTQVMQQWVDTLHNGPIPS